MQTSRSYVRDLKDLIPILHSRIRKVKNVPRFFHLRVVLSNANAQLFTGVYIKSIDRQ